MRIPQHLTTRTKQTNTSYPELSLRFEAWSKDTALIMDGLCWTRCPHRFTAFYCLVTQCQQMCLHNLYCLSLTGCQYVCGNNWRLRPACRALDQNRILNPTIWCGKRTRMKEWLRGTSLSLLWRWGCKSGKESIWSSDMSGGFPWMNKRIDDV